VRHFAGSCEVSGSGAFEPGKAVAAKVAGRLGACARCDSVCPAGAVSRHRLYGEACSWGLLQRRRQGHQSPRPTVHCHAHYLHTSGAHCRLSARRVQALTRALRASHVRRHQRTPAYPGLAQLNRSAARPKARPMPAPAYLPQPPEGHEGGRVVGSVGGGGVVTAVWRAGVARSAAGAAKEVCRTACLY